MKRLIVPISLLCCVLFSSCRKATPQDTFNTAVLNANLLHGFAGRGLQMQLEQPSIKLTGQNMDQQVPMKRAEVIDGKIQAAEEALGKIRKLPVDADSGVMIGASVALHEFVLPVYRNEYAKLAKLYDSGAPPDEIRALEQDIATKYQAKFAELHEALTAAGKAYAAKHGIQVQWHVRTSPGGR